MKNVVIYSTPTCHFCREAKEFFKKNNITYVEHDVAGDRKIAEELLEKSAQMSVPVIFIDNDMVIGFDQPRLKELLGI